MFKKIWAPSCVLLLMSCGPGTMDLEGGTAVANSSQEGDGHVVDDLPANGDSETSENDVIDPFGDIFKPTQWVGNTPVRWSTCGTRPAYHPCNFVLLDQNGEEFQLYDHYDKAIVVDFSAGWCGPCKRAADVVQEHSDTYAAEGLLYVTVLIETANREDPTVADLQAWADEHNITSAPVLAGSRALLESGGGDWALTGWPTFYFVKREMDMHITMRGWSEEMLVELIEEILE
jgi:thiol-disulfide isomerase/thioredoxin